MATRKESMTTSNPQMHGSGKKRKMPAFLVVLLILVIIIAVFGGVFYFIVFNNIGGVTENHYAKLKRIPVLNLALPEEPDPLDPKYMTQAEINDQYRVFRRENEELKKQLEEANARIEEYRVYKEKYDNKVTEAEIMLKDLEEREARVREKETALKELQLKIDESIANGDKESFKTYFEDMDPENSKAIYERIARELQVDGNVKKYAQVIENMDADAAAAVFERMGAGSIGEISETLRAMSKEGASKILESMSPDFAAKVVEKLGELYRGN
jgi:flagellar motility protein MotE (MotC chaperone)